MGVTSKAMQINGRPVLAQGGAETLKSLIASVAAKGLAITLCIGLAACAEDRNYPSLSKDLRFGKHFDSARAAKSRGGAAKTRSGSQQQFLKVCRPAMIAG